MDSTINGRTPEEIKKGLECCMGVADCLACPYKKEYSDGSKSCVETSTKDALAYIQQLENHIGELTEKVKQLERERNAAVEDMTELMHLGKFCRHCKHLTEDGECTFDFAANKCAPWNCWQWRGVQEVE